MLVCNGRGPGRYRSRFRISRPTTRDFLLTGFALKRPRHLHYANTEPGAVATG